MGSLAIAAASVSTTSGSLLGRPRERREWVSAQLSALVIALAWEVSAGAGRR